MSTASVEVRIVPSFADHAFVQLIERHRGELRLHCYRMLGSSHDSDDMLQETCMRAWRAKDSLHEPSHARAWLYRIATHVCLDELGRRRARRLPNEAGPPADPLQTIQPGERETWVEPCPDTWLAATSGDPAARYEARESVRLAFVAALQHLSSSQRATLLLRDVVGLSADETARALEISVEAGNSALFRARSAVEAKLGGRDPADFARIGEAAQELLARYLRAWNAIDVESFVSLLHDEVRTTMPPSPMWIAGRAHNVVFYRRMFAAQRPGIFLALPTAANAQPAFAFYRALQAGEPYCLRAIQLVSVRDGAIANIDHFMLPELGPVFGLPQEIARADAAIAPDGRPCIKLHV